MGNVSIACSKQVELLDFLKMNGFYVEKASDAVYKVTRDEEIPVYMHIDDKTIYFESDLGSMEKLNQKELYFDLLDLNTEILPVSLGIDTTNSDDPRLVLVESREVQNLDDNELLSVFDALELALDKVELILKKYMA